MQTVATFGDGLVANLAKARLQDAGIRTFLANERTVGVAPHLTNAIGGIRLQVADDDVNEARALLADHEPVRPAALHRAGKPDYSEEELAADEASIETTLREEMADRALRGAVISILFFPLQLYVAWLLYKVFFSDERLGARHLRNAIIAAALCLPCVVLIFCFLRISFI